jgi:hypothetical protein
MLRSSSMAFSTSSSAKEKLDFFSYYEIIKSISYILYVILKIDSIYCLGRPVRRGPTTERERERGEEGGGVGVSEEMAKSQTKCVTVALSG